MRAGQRDALLLLDECGVRRGRRRVVLRGNIEVEGLNGR